MYFRKKKKTDLYFVAILNLVSLVFIEKYILFKFSTNIGKLHFLLKLYIWMVILDLRKIMTSSYFISGLLSCETGGIKKLCLQFTSIIKMLTVLQNWCTTDFSMICNILVCEFSMFCSNALISLSTKDLLNWFVSVEINRNLCN